MSYITKNIYIVIYTYIYNYEDIFYRLVIINEIKFMTYIYYIIYNIKIFIMKISNYRIFSLFLYRIKFFLYIYNDKRRYDN